MPVRIKKTVFDNMGRIVEEYDGTEAEVEAYEKKKEKKNQSETVKKERKLLLDSAKSLGKMTKKELLELIQKSLADLRAKEIHHYHWYYNNGYWWKPCWDGGSWVYLTTTNNPEASTWSGTYVANSNVLNDGHVVTCNSLDELTKSTGIGAEAVYTSMLSQPSTAGAIGVYSSSIGCTADQGASNMLIGDANQKWGQYEEQYKGSVSMTAAPVTSGIINMNIRS